jgi:hypothetical protein
MLSVAPRAELPQERDQLVEGEASKTGSKKESKKGAKKGTKKGNRERP